MFSLDLILLMLAVGAMAGMVTAAFDANLVIQILVAAARPWARSRWCDPTS